MVVAATRARRRIGGLPWHADHPREPGDDMLVVAGTPAPDGGALGDGLAR
jgi:hypothetical protein